MIGLHPSRLNAQEKYGTDSTQPDPTQLNPWMDPTHAGSTQHSTQYSTVKYIFIFIHQSMVDNVKKEREKINKTHHISGEHEHK